MCRVVRLPKRASEWQHPVSSQSVFCRGCRVKSDVYLECRVTNVAPGCGDRIWLKGSPLLREAGIPASRLDAVESEQFSSAPYKTHL